MSMNYNEINTYFKNVNEELDVPSSESNSFAKCSWNEDDYQKSKDWSIEDWLKKYF